MALPLAPSPERVPLHVLFPEQYAKTRRMIVRDFLLMGALIVAMVVGTAWFYNGYARV
jgi:hypothetical protein